MQPSPDYPKCMDFLKGVAASLDLPYKVTKFLNTNAHDPFPLLIMLLASTQVTECVPDIPVMVISWPGTEPDLPAVMLNSHTDVVPGRQHRLP